MDTTRVFPAVVLMLWCNIHLSLAFLESPVNRTVALNSTASFTCRPTHSHAEEVAWIVLLPDIHKYYVSTAHPEEFDNRGITFHSDGLTSFLDIPASIRNNGTSMRCREFSIDSGTVFSEEAFLNVAGPPLPPALVTSQLSPLEIQVLWEEPFTSENYPVLDYTVEVTELATGLSVVFTSPTPDYTHATSNAAMECRELRIVVWATNAVGSSDPVSITTGFPIVPAEDFDNFSTEVRAMNTDHEISIAVKPPPVCLFQEAWLLLNLLHLETNESIFIASRTYSGNTPTFEFHIMTTLRPGHVYTLVAMVITAGGNVTKTQLIRSTEDSSTTAEAVARMRSLWRYWIGGVIGGVVFVVVIILLISALLLKLRAHRTSSSSLLKPGTNHDSI